MAGNEKRLIDVDKAKKDFNLHFGGVSHAVIANRILDEQPTVDAVPVADIEAWLYQIAMNNTDNTLCGACEELIRRLDGLRQFSKERED